MNNSPPIHARTKLIRWLQGASTVIDAALGTVFTDERADRHAVLARFELSHRGIETEHGSKNLKEPRTLATKSWNG